MSLKFNDTYRWVNYNHEALSITQTDQKWSEPVCPLGSHCRRILWWNLIDSWRQSFQNDLRIFPAAFTFQLDDHILEEWKECVVIALLLTSHCQPHLFLSLLQNNDLLIFSSSLKVITAQSFTSLANWEFK